MVAPRVKARGQNAPNTYNVTRRAAAVKGIVFEVRTISDLDENAVTVPNTQDTCKHTQTQRHKTRF